MQQEFQALKDFSTKIGSDPILVQAAGGNTSLKHDGIMWIKASGTWLRDAKTKELFVPLNMKRLSAALDAEDPSCESCTEFVVNELNSQALRPSIETSVHGLMPQNIVVHVHCVSTIAWVIQPDAEDKLQALLADFNWSYVPYARPGLRLARAIRQRLKPDTDVLILGNHGLAVAADTVAAAEQLLTRVVKALELRTRDQPEPDISALQGLADGTNYNLPSELRCHDVALDNWSCRTATKHAYYPDHVVFLGTQLPSNLNGQSAALAFPGKGVLIRRDAKPAVEPMLRCLSDVFSRLKPDTPLKRLTDEDVDMLLNWDAEIYRQNLKA